MAVTLAGRRAAVTRHSRRARRPLMQKFVIEGGVPLSGTLAPAGNKNGALPILAASVLTEDEVVVRNVPRIRDVEAMLQILETIGVSVQWRGPQQGGAVRLRRARGRRRGSRSGRADPGVVPAGRAAARAIRARDDAPPGGDVIGRRRLDPHVDAFRNMGAEVDCERDIVLSAPRGLRPGSECSWTSRP